MGILLCGGQSWQRAIADMHLLKRLAKAPLRGLHLFLPSCREAIRLQSEALDRPLPLHSRLGLRLHLLVCAWCRRYGKQIRFLRRAAREHPEQLTTVSPNHLSPEARERIERALGGNQHPK